MSGRHGLLSRIAGSIRAILPRPEIVAVAVGILVILEGFWATARYLDPHGTSPLTCLAIRDTAVVVLLSAFGCFRVFAFHPLFNPEYRNWLNSSPWQKGKPLPLGPVYPGVADAVVVLGLALLLADPRIVTHEDFMRPNPVSAVAMFAIAHASAIAASVWMTQPRTLAYAAYFLLAAALRLGQIWSPLLPLFLLAGWAVALKGLSESWSLFPWDETVDWGGRLKRRWKTMQSQGVGLLMEEMAPDRVAADELGWPFAALSPWTPTTVIGKRERLLIATLLSFWLHAVLYIFRKTMIDDGIALMFLGYVVFFMAIARLAEIGGHHASPLNLAGRFFLFSQIFNHFGCRGTNKDQIAVFLIPAFQDLL